MSLKNRILTSRSKLKYDYFDIKPKPKKPLSVSSSNKSVILEGQRHRHQAMEEKLEAQMKQITKFEKEQER